MLGYRWRPSTMVYATYSHSEQSVGLNVGLLSAQVLANGVTEAVAPKGADNYEVGIKSALFDRRLTLDLDAFWEDVSNYQTNAVFLINGGRYDVSMWVQNLFDTDYLTNIQENNGAFLGFLGDPRTFGATLKAAF